jgi:hypothetical protein
VWLCGGPAGRGGLLLDTGKRLFDSALSEAFSASSTIEPKACDIEAGNGSWTGGLLRDELRWSEVAV